MTTNTIFSLDTLKNLGIDFKVTKQDIIDHIVDQYEEQVDADIAAAQSALDTFDATYKKTIDAYIAAECKRFENEPVVKGLVKNFASLNIVAKDSIRIIGYTRYDSRLDFVIRFAYLPDTRLSEQSVSFSIQENPFKDGRNKLVEDLEAAYNKKRELAKMGKRVKRELLKNILSTTEDGIKLLNALDGTKTATLPSNVPTPPAASKCTKKKS